MSKYEELVESIKRSAETIVNRERERDVKDLARRDQHAKHHGCVWGYLDVLPSLPERLRVGIFAPSARYRAWVRFSNSSPRASKDTTPDGRGIAIKLLLEDATHLGKPAGTQDFILLNHSAFFAENLEEMESIFRWQAEGKWLPRYFVRHLRLRGLWAIWKLACRPDSVLDLTYYTQLPGAFGEQQNVKYRLRQISGVEPTKPTKIEKASGDHLRHVLRRQLRPNQRDRANVFNGREPNRDEPNGDVLFALEVQFREPKEHNDVANVSWQGPFKQVAVLRVPRQDFEHPDRTAFAEDIAFSVWNTLPAHEPRADLSRARKEVYEHVSDYRHKQNGHSEPAYTLAKWQELRALPPSPVSTDVELKDVIAALSPTSARWLEKVFAWRFAALAVPLAVLCVLLGAVFFYPQHVGRTVLIDSPLRALGFTMKSEDLIPRSDPQDYRLTLESNCRNGQSEYDPNDPEWQFRYGQMGAEFSAGIPYWVYRVLPDVAPDQIKGWSDFGLVNDDDQKYYADYHGLPRGLAMSDSLVTIGNMDLGIKLKRVALNCASCHRGEVRIDGETRFINGMPNLSFDAASFKRKLNAAIASKAFTSDRVIAAIDDALAKDHQQCRSYNPQRRRSYECGDGAMADRQARQCQSSKPHRLSMYERLVYTYIVHIMKKSALAKDSKLAWMDRRPDNGPGRLDAFGAFRLEVLDFPDAPEDTPREKLLVATVDLPSVWNQGPRYRPSHHYDGNTDDARARNIGAIIGVGGHPLSVRFRTIQRVAQWLDDELGPPAYPGREQLDRDSVQHGKVVYEQKCQSCHGSYDEQHRLREPTFCMKAAKSDLAHTDAHRSWAVDEPLVDKLNELGEKSGIWERHSFKATGAYLCPPLDGIWARAPYLHNGSVPTLDHLLSGLRPPRFIRGNPAYDRTRGGFESEHGAEDRLSFAFETSEPGNGAGGHDSEQQLVKDTGERHDLIQYLYQL